MKPSRLSRCSAGAPALLLIAAAMMVGLFCGAPPCSAVVIDSSMEVDSNMVMDGYVFEISTTIPSDGTTIDVNVPTPRITGGGMELHGWPSSPPGGTYAFSFTVSGGSIRDSQFRGVEAMPTGTLMRFYGMQAVSSVQQVVFDMSAMIFGNNVSVEIINSHVTLSDLAVDLPIVQVGAGLNLAAINDESEIQLVGMRSFGGRSLLQLQQGGGIVAGVSVTDKSLISVRSFRSCGLSTAVVEVHGNLLVSDNSMFRVRDGVLDNCTSAYPGLDRLPHTMVQHHNDVTVQDNSVYMIVDVKLPGGTALDVNPTSAFDVLPTGILTIKNIDTSSFCLGCEAGIPTTNEGTVYAGGWTLDGLPTEDYAGQHLGRVTPLDREGRLSDTQQCPVATCIPTFGQANPDTSSGCDCTCTQGTFADACLPRPDVSTTFTGCTTPNCASCPDHPDRCQFCWDGYDLRGQECVRVQCDVQHCRQCRTQNARQCQLCVEGYYMTPDFQCVRCDDPNCATCTSTECQVCFNGAAPTNGRCDPITTCGVQYCQLCVAGNGRACRQCQSGYGLLANQQCGLCTDPNCAKCDGDITKCTECREGTTITDYNTCSIGAKCLVPNCAYCEARNQNRCAQCIAGYNVNTVNGQCLQRGSCAVPNCAACHPDFPNRCTRCNAGYVVDSTTGQCTVGGQCGVANCAQCVSGQSTRCQRCQTGYVVTSTGACRRSTGCRVYYCRQCMADSDIRCYQCHQGYGITTARTCVRARYISTNGVSAPPRSLVLALAALVVAVAVFLL